MASNPDDGNSFDGRNPPENPWGRPGAHGPPFENHGTRASHGTVTRARSLCLSPLSHSLRSRSGDTGRKGQCGCDRGPRTPSPHLCPHCARRTHTCEAGPVASTLGTSCLPPHPLTSPGLQGSLPTPQGRPEDTPSSAVVSSWLSHLVGRPAAAVPADPSPASQAAAPDSSAQHQSANCVSAVLPLRLL